MDQFCNPSRETIKQKKGKEKRQKKGRAHGPPGWADRMAARLPWPPIDGIDRGTQRLVRSSWPGLPWHIQPGNCPGSHVHTRGFAPHTR
jgi:hypothetical protein